MDIQAITARIESIILSGVEGVEQALHDALDSVETVLGINPGEETGSTGAAAAADDVGNGAVAADANTTDNTQTAAAPSTNTTA